MALLRKKLPTHTVSFKILARAAIRSRALFEVLAVSFHANKFRVDAPSMLARPQGVSVVDFRKAIHDLEYDTNRYTAPSAAYVGRNQLQKLMQALGTESCNIV